MDYTPTQINRLADEAPWTGVTVGALRFSQGEIFVYRFALIGGAPHDTPQGQHITVLGAMAAVPGVDSSQYEVLGVTLLPIPSGIVLTPQTGDDVTSSDRSWICDVVVRIRVGEFFYLDADDLTAAVAAGLASWAGGYAPNAYLLAAIGTRAAEGQTYSALEVWGTQTPLLFGANGKEPQKLNEYEVRVKSGSFGMGLAYGLSDYPAELVPMKWSTSLVTPQPQPIGPNPVGPGTPKAPGEQASGQQNLLIMAACAAAGYLVYRKFAGKR